MKQALTSQDLAQKGKAAYKNGEYLISAESYREAAEAYRASGDDFLAAEMLNNCSVAYLQSGNGQLALEAVEGTVEVFADAGDYHRQAMAIGNRASALEALKRFEEAEKAYRNSAEILKEIGELDDRLHVLQSLSSMQLQMGRRFEAYASMYAGIMSIERPNARQRLLKALMQIPYKLFK